MHILITIAKKLITDKGYPIVLKNFTHVRIFLAFDYIKWPSTNGTTLPSDIFQEMSLFPFHIYTKNKNVYCPIRRHV